MPPDDFPEIDTQTASIARLYDYMLGGTDNYPADRQAADLLEDMFPGAFAGARNNRRYLERVVHYLAAECGIRQFIDYGSGLPTQNNVHHVAQGVAPGARVVYVDSDPVVLRHQKFHALLPDDKTTAFIEEDARNVERILDHPDTQRLIDFDEPVGALYISFLHCIPDSDDPWGLIRRTTDRLAPGSYLAISHGVSDNPEVRRKVTETLVAASGGNWGRLREPAEVHTFFNGLEIVEPGLVKVTAWHSDGGDEEETAMGYEYGGVARKPD
jgi:SAM-dependent methyltransferase